MEAFSPGDLKDRANGVTSRGLGAVSLSIETDQTPDEANDGGIPDLSQHRWFANKRLASQSGTVINAKRPRLHDKLPQEYVDLLNGEIRDAAMLARGTLPDIQSQNDSRYGAIRWTESDRRAFFDNLARGSAWDEGRVHISCRSQSVFEHRDYEARLKQSLVERELTAKRNTLFRPSDVPAATDVSPECDVALEVCADETAKQIFDAEQAREIDRHGKYGLLDSKSAAEMQSYLHDGDQSGMRGHSTPDQGAENNHPYDTVLPAAKVLNLEAMLHLSDKLYTHCEAALEHRELIADADISMFATAFTDLYAVVEAVTKRIVAASIFQANTRLRGTDYGEKKRRKLKIRAQDVRSALDILALPVNSACYWQGLARRLDLKVFTRPSSTGTRYRRWLSFDEVEYELGARQADGGEVREEHEGNVDVADHSAESSANEVFSDDGRPSVEDSSDEVDQYLDALDRKRNAEDELELWTMLGGTPPTHTDEAAGADLPPAPSSQRRSVVDLKGWKEHCDYRSAWELYGTRTSEVEQSFAEPRPTFRGIGASEQTATDVPTGDGGSTDPSSDTNTAAVNDPTSEDTANDDRIDSTRRGRTLRRRTSASDTAIATRLTTQVQLSDADDNDDDYDDARPQI